MIKPDMEQRPEVALGPLSKHSFEPIRCRLLNVGADMRRREFLSLVGGAAAVWPLAARAQARPVLGFLGSGSRGAADVQVAGFLEGLKEAGFVDGQNVKIEYRWAGAKFDLLPALAAELVRLPADAIFAAQGSVTASAAKRATSTIPVVFATSDDPVATGLVASLNHPGGNLTGVARLGTELGGKNLELLHSLLPTVSAIGLLADPTLPDIEARVRNVQDAASALGKTIHVLNASNQAQIDKAFDVVVSQRIGALLVPFSSLFNSRRDQIVALAARHRIPTAYAVREYVTAGGLMSYGDNTAESYKLGGELVGRILKGAKPGDLPVQQATKLELAINLKTAKALGLTIPITLLGRADEVIE
jgi:putative ABC transport system substrate-binding protein